MEEALFIFFTGCLSMAMLYHFVLYLIQKNKLLLLYTFYLFAATLFLAERVWIDESFNGASLFKEKYFILLDEPIQLFIYVTYFRFVSLAIGLDTIPDKKFVFIFRIADWLLIFFSLFHIAGILLNWFEQRTLLAFITVRIIMVVIVLLMFFMVSKHVSGLFFKFIIAGSVIMLAGGMLAFLTSLFNTTVFGIYGVMWTCISLFLDVICFSAALGYKARKDFEEKQAALKQLIVTEKQLQQKELEKINAIYSAKEADRSRIARDLHDEIGSTLSSIHIYTSVAEKTLLSDPDNTKKVLQQININARTVMESMSDIVWAMKTGHENDVLLSTKIKNVGYEMLSAKNISCRYEINHLADAAVLDVDLRRNILLIVKESLNNIVKYSEASEVVIQIEIKENTIILCLFDNGKGFDFNSVLKGNGLENINFRAQKFGGYAAITSQKNSGTSIICKFPLTNIREEIKNP